MTTTIGSGRSPRVGYRQLAGRTGRRPRRLFATSTGPSASGAPARNGCTAGREHEAIGRRSHDLLATRLPQPLDAIQAVLLADGAWRGELQHRTRDGRTLSVASHWALQRTSGRPAEPGRRGQPRHRLPAAGDRGDTPAGGHRRIVQRRHHRQGPGRHRHPLEPRRRSDVRLSRRGDRRPPDRRAVSARPRGGRGDVPGAHPAGARRSSITRRCGSARTAARFRSR